MTSIGLVSVIVPVYNTEPYLPRCIESVLQQDYHDIELILVDDGSSDESLATCYRYMQTDNRVRVFHQQNSGVCCARNTGLTHMRGNFFMFLDSDDSIEPDIISKVLSCFSQNTSVDMFVFGWKKVFSDGRTDQYTPENDFVHDMTCATKKLLEHYDGYGGGYPNKIWKAVSFSGNIPKFDEKLFYFEDMEWMTRMFLNIHVFACISESGYNYYIRGDSTTFQPGLWDKREYGYHISALKIVDDLSGQNELCNWYRDIYYPQIVNGIINAWRKRSYVLGKWLLVQMRGISRELMRSDNISFRIKIRCLLLSALFWIR